MSRMKSRPASDPIFSARDILRSCRGCSRVRAYVAKTRVHAKCTPKTLFSVEPTRLEVAFAEGLRLDRVEPSALCQAATTTAGDGRGGWGGHVLQTDLSDLPAVQA